MSVELAIPSPVKEIVPPGWWHDVAQPVIESAESDDELAGYSRELKAYIGIFEALGREDKLELVKAQRVVEKRRGELLTAEPYGGDRRSEDFQVRRAEFENSGLSAGSVSDYRRIAKAWPVIQDHLLAATDLREVSQKALLNIARTVLEDEGAPVPTDGLKIPRAKRAKQIEKLAAAGHTAAQIASKLGVSAETVRDIANEYEITFPLAGHQNRVDPNEVVERVISSLEADVLALDLIKGTEEQLDRSQVERWVNSLDDSLSRLRKLSNQLKELTHG